MEYLDKLAEAAVKEAIQSVVKNGKRANSRSVPPEARRLLLEKGRGRVSQSDAAKRVQQAVERLKERKEIKAPNAANSDWGLISRQQPDAADADAS